MLCQGPGVVKAGFVSPDMAIKGERLAMSQPTVRIMCPNLSCRKLLAVPESARSKTVRCKACHTAIRVPEAPSPQAQNTNDEQKKSA
jgi:LSD1 subclass zinc finger protein